MIHISEKGALVLQKFRWFMTRPIFVYFHGLLLLDRPENDFYQTGLKINCMLSFVWRAPIEAYLDYCVECEQLFIKSTNYW